MNDGQQTGRPDTISIEVVTADHNRPPTANAGTDRIVAIDQWVTLGGLYSSDPDNDALTYEWVQTAGAKVTLADPTSARPTFYALTKGVVEFELVVHDSHAPSAPCSVRVLVNAVGNAPPVAHAGLTTTATLGTMITLDGSDSSDADGEPLAYQWVQISGPAAILSNATAPQPTFAATTAGIVAFELTVNDGTVASLADQVVITVSSPTNHLPIANAGADTQARVGDVVTLDGSRSSDEDADELHYGWRVDPKSPSAAAIELADPTGVNPTFIASGAGVFTFGLVVDDGVASSVEDLVTVTVTGANQPPVAAATSTTNAALGERVDLDGTQSSDPNNDPLSFKWRQSGGPQVIIVNSENSVATFIAATVGEYEFELTVSDGVFSSTTTVVIYVASDDPSASVGGTGRGCTTTVADTNVLAHLLMVLGLRTAISRWRGVLNRVRPASGCIRENTTGLVR